MAYYRTVPKDKEQTRYEAVSNKKSIKFPKLKMGSYLLEYLDEMSYGSYSAMGDKLPLSFQDIDAFMRATQTPLNRWEVLALRQLSHDYIIQSQKKDANELPPYLEVSEADYLKQTAVSKNAIAMKFGIAL